MVMMAQMELEEARFGSQASARAPWRSGLQAMVAQDAAQPAPMALVLDNLDTAAGPLIQKHVRFHVHG